MNRFLFTIVTTFYLLSVNLYATDIPTVIIGLIDNGILSIESYTRDELTETFSREMRKHHTLFTLNLANDDYKINTVTCDCTTNNLIKLSEQSFTKEHSFFINWGATIGLNIADYQTNCISFVPWQHHEIPSNFSSLDAESNKTITRAIYTIDGNSHEAIIHFDCHIDSICGIIITNKVDIIIDKTQRIINFTDAIEQGIIVPSQNILEGNKKIIIEQDAEFDQILEAMSNDGVIKIEPASPFVSWLRSIGGNILVQYLTAKKYLCAFFYKIFYTNNTKEEQLKNNNQPAQNNDDHEQKTGTI